MSKILVIEDEDQIRDNIQDILILSDFDALVAKDGYQGLQLAQLENPDLIICDIMMPKVNGYEVLQMLKKDTRTEDIPFVFLTAKSDRDDLRQGMVLGADDYLTKPFTPEELLEAITIRLGKKEHHHQKRKEEMDQLRNSIILSMPHELNTPLNGMILSAQFLQDCAESLEVEEIKDIANSFLVSAKRLHQLTTKFLLYAELAIVASNLEKMVALRTQSSWATSLIAEIALSKAQQSGREHDLKLDLTSEKVMIAVSNSKFNHLLLELLDNAFKFSKPGTIVKVSSKLVQDQFHIWIQDQGRGMTLEQINQVGAYIQFERKFYEQQGSGLGLVIAKLITHIYGGSLSIDSILGQNTMVHLTLPVNSK